MKLNLRALIIYLILVINFGCSSVRKKNSNDSLPKPDHIIILMLENLRYETVMGSPIAPFINEIAKESASFTNAHGITHPSQPNYIGLFSGSLQGIKGDACIPVDSPFTTPNLGRALIDAGYNFVSYSQTIPYAGFSGCNYGESALNDLPLYVRRHCPWVNWYGAKKNGLDSSKIGLPMSEFPDDFDELPTVGFVIPDCDYDMHNRTGNMEMIRRGDDWIKCNLSDYIEWAKSHNSLFVLTFDEDDGSSRDNHIPTLFIGEMINPGKYEDSINLYNILRTIEHMYDLEPSGDAEAAAITSVWK